MNLLQQHIRSCEGCQRKFDDVRFKPLKLVVSRSGMTSVIYNKVDWNDHLADHENLDLGGEYMTINAFLHYFPVNNIPPRFVEKLRKKQFKDIRGIVYMRGESGFLKIKCLRENRVEVLQIIDRLRLFVCHESVDYGMHLYPADQLPRIELALDTDMQIRPEEFVSTLEHENRHVGINTKDIQFLGTEPTQTRMRNRFDVGPRNAHYMIKSEFLRYRGRNERVFLCVNPFDEAQ